MEQILFFFFNHKESIFVIALSIFLGIEVISNVPAVLHTPLMSGANAISGVIIIGGYYFGWTCRPFRFFLLTSAGCSGIVLRNPERSGWICRYRPYARNV